MNFLKFAALLSTVAVCYGFDVFHSQSKDGRYRFSYNKAHEHCRSLGSHLATKDELEELRKTNYSMCHCGWTLDKTAHFPMTTSVDGCGESAGLHDCNWRDSWDAYCFKGDLIGNCSRSLGIENGDIRDHQLYASTEYRSSFPIFRSSRWTAQIARLHNKDLVNAWIPKYNGRHQWLEVDLGQPTTVTGIVTQGASRLGKKMWVTSYLIKYSKDRYNYRTVQENGADKEFVGNVNNNGLKRNMFPETVLARYIRFVPISYHGDVALRLELLGCNLNTYLESLSRSQEEDVEVAPSQSDLFPEIFVVEGN